MPGLLARVLESLSYTTRVNSTWCYCMYPSVKGKLLTEALLPSCSGLLALEFSPSSIPGQSGLYQN